MKKSIQLLTSLICFALGITSVHGVSTNYWDSNGITNGAGTTPTGTWGSDSFWSTNSFGTNATAAWISGNTAVFSAGTDATDTFTVTVSGIQTAENLTVEEGNITFSDYTAGVNVGGAVPGKGFINIASNLTTRMSAILMGGDDNGRITKTGAGTLVLDQWNAFGGEMIVGEGILAIENGVALADNSIPTIVSNGATLHMVGNISVGEPVILYGNGVTNNGALLGGAGTGGSFGGGVTLGSDARINSGGGDPWRWGKQVVGNNFNVTFGGAGRFIFNIPYPIQVGAGVIIKDGTSRLQLHNPCTCSAFYLNGGDVYPQFGNVFGSGIIYVAAGDTSLSALFADPTVNNAMSLAANANLMFICNQGHNFTYNGVISGAGGLSKTNSGLDNFTGTLFLTKANTYFGNTTICGGPLVLGVNGSIANSAVIDVWTNATFDVSAKVNGFVLGAAQTLRGNGTVVGNVTANGTIAPGAPVGVLAFTGDLTLAGNLSIDVDKSLSPSNDVITVVGTLTNAGTGTVTVANLGSALVVGDSFQLFDKPVLNGQALTVVGAGVTWTNKLALDGSIAVLTPPLPGVPATNLTIVAVGPTSFSLGGRGGASQAYRIYASTNVTTPMTNWWLIGTTNSSAGGVIQFVDPQATNRERFYRFGQPQ